MYSFEVPPPADVWQKIAAELDESELSQQFPSRLYNISVAPASHIWQSIAATLDEPILVSDYSAKLAGIAIVPPAATWTKIKNSLDAGHETAIPEHRRFSPFLKYAAAAAIIVFLAWGGVQLFTNKSGETTVAKKDTTQPNKDTETATINNTVVENIAVSDVTASMEEARNDAALEASKKTYAKLDVAASRSKIKNAAGFFFVADDYDYTPIGTIRGFDINSKDILPELPSTNIAKRYIMLLTPDGNIIRMSKKLSELVCCVSGEEQDKDCVDQMKKWREKIANPSTTHSSSNFMDILSIVNAMQDN